MRYLKSERSSKKRQSGSSKRSSHEMRALCVLFVGVLALTFAGSHLLDDRYATSKARALMGFAGRDFDDSLDDLFSSVMRFQAVNLARFYETSSAPGTREELVEFAKGMRVDEITVAGPDRRWKVSSDEKVGRGFLASNEFSAAFLNLYEEGHDEVIQPFRPSIDNPEVFAKYVAVPFPDRSGILEVGVYESSIASDDYGFFSDIWISDWRVGGTGWFITADARTKRIIAPSFGMPVEIAGRTTDELGLKAAAAGDWAFDPDPVVFAGEPCWVSSRSFAEHDIYIVLPLREFAVERTMILVLPAVLLIVVFVVVAFMLHKRDVARAAEESLRDAELERLESDIRLAAVIQHNSLPQHFPPYPEIADRIGIYAAMKPAREVGGDFYDFRRVGAHKLLFTVADVSDKGVPAAMFMMRAKVTLLGECSSRSDLAAGVEATNRMLCAGNDDGMFVTAWVGVLDLSTGVLNYVNAGHNPPLVRRADGSTEFLAGDPDLPLGVMEGESYVIRESRLAAADILLVYTDGVTEAANANGDLFGEDRLVKTFSTDITDSKGICDNILATVATFASGTRQSDDITVLAVKVNGLAGADKSAVSRIARRSIRPVPCDAHVDKAVFPAVEASVQESEAFIGSACPGPDAAVVIDELVSNIVRCSQAKSFSITVTAGRVIEVADDGIPFNPLQSDSADIESLPDGGVNGHMGLFIVQQLAESVVYERKDGRNVLTVTMKPESVKKV